MEILPQFFLLEGNVIACHNDTPRRIMMKASNFLICLLFIQTRGSKKESEHSDRYFLNFEFILQIWHSQSNRFCLPVARTWVKRDVGDAQTIITESTKGGSRVSQKGCVSLP